MTHQGDHFVLKGLENQSPGELLALLIEISHRLDSRFDEKSIWRQFQFLAADLREHCRNLDPQKRLETLCTFVFHTRSFKEYGPGEIIQDDLLLGSCLTKRAAHPIVLSVLFLALAEQVSLSLQMIDEPNHSMIRCTLDLETKLIEISRSGYILNSNDVITWCNKVLARDENQLPSLKSLNARVVLERYLLILLSSFLKLAHRSKANFVLDLLLDLDATNMDWLRQKAIVAFELELFSEAKGAIQRFIHFHAEVPLPTELQRIKRELSSQRPTPVLH